MNKSSVSSTKPDIWTLQTATGNVDVWSFGAAIHNLTLIDADGRPFQPLAEADWLESGQGAPVSGAPHLQTLGGEWPCVPFGSIKMDPDHHGFGANNDWYLVTRDEASISLAIDYPVGHPVESLQRTIQLHADAPIIEMTLSVKVRERCLVPIGLHPIFKLPLNGDRLALDVPADGPAMSAPKPLMPASAKLPASSDLSLDCLSISDQQDLVQVWNAKGDTRLTYPLEGQSVRLSWDAKKLPHCLLWIAAPAIFDEHQKSPFFGLGVEPIHSYFDSNDLSATQLAGQEQAQSTGVWIEPDEDWSVTYQISLVA